MASTSCTDSMQENNEVTEVEQNEPVWIPMNDSHIDRVEEILGYKFSDRRLVEDAMTLRSFYYPLKPAKSHGRLEFLGDSLLNYVVTTKLFFANPDLSPGNLTQLRSANTDKEKLARIAIVHGFHHLMRHKESQLNTLTQEFIQEMKHYPIHSTGLLDAPKALSDVVESLIGAIYVDTNMSYDTVEKIFMRLSQPFITIDVLGKHPVSELNEICQGLEHELKVNNMWAQSQTIEVLLDEMVIGSATYGRRKDVCHNRAAKMAVDRIKELLRENKLKLKPKADS